MDIEHARAKAGREVDKAMIEIKEDFEKSKQKYQVEIDAAWQKTTQSIRAERAITSRRISSIHKSAFTHQKRQIDIISEQAASAQHLAISNRVAKKNMVLAEQQNTKTKEACEQLCNIRGQLEETLDNLWKSEQKLDHLTHCHTKEVVSLNAKIRLLEEEGQLASSDLVESIEERITLEDKHRLAIEVCL